MEKVIGKLEQHIKGLENITKGYRREIEELNGNAQDYESTIEGKRQYVKELKKALAVTEKKSDSSHQYLLDELERSRRIKERQEEYLIGVRKEIEEIEKSLQEVVEQIKDAENTINELKGATPDPAADVQNNTFGGFVMGGLVREANRELPEMYVKGGRADEDWRLTLESSIHLNNAINESVAEALKNIEKSLIANLPDSADTTTK